MAENEYEKIFPLHERHSNPPPNTVRKIGQFDSNEIY